MKVINKTALATVATLFALTIGVAEANPLGGFYGGKVRFNNSFNTDKRVDTRVDNSQRFKRDLRLNFNADNSRYTDINKIHRTDLQYNVHKDKLNAGQNIESKRNYYSNVNQSGFNKGSARGHSMKQNQGGTAVGSLVKETNSNYHNGHNLLSPAASTGQGDTATGNMKYSQIGGMQSAIQVGNTTNLQNNSQVQDAASGVSSSDTVSNSAAK